MPGMMRLVFQKGAIVAVLGLDHILEELRDPPAPPERRLKPLTEQDWRDMRLSDAEWAELPARLVDRSAVSRLAYETFLRTSPRTPMPAGLSHAVTR